MFSVFGVRVLVTFHHYMLVHIRFSSVWVVNWSPFEKELPNQLTMCYHICSFSYFPFGIEGNYPSSWSFILVTFTKYLSVRTYDLFVPSICLPEIGRKLKITIVVTVLYFAVRCSTRMMNTF